MMKSSRDSSGFFIVIFFVEIGVVKSHLDGRTLRGQFVQTHARLVERLAEVFVAAHRPAQLKQVLLRVELDAGLLLVGTCSAIGQRAGAGVFPHGRQRVLKLPERYVGAQGHFTMNVNFKRGVVA